MTLDLEDALTMMEALYSAEDPIIFEGKEMDFSQLVYGEYEKATDKSFSGVDIKDIHIKFWGYNKKKQFGLRRGTVHSMILDRLRGDYA